MLRTLIGSVVVALAVATGASAGTSALSSKTLQLGDLPTGYTQIKSSACLVACVKKAQGKVPVGFVSGWERDYVGHLETIASIVSSYKTTIAARASVLSTWAAAGQDCKRVSIVEKIGDEARMFHCNQTGISGYIVTWRSGKFKATLLIVGNVSSGERAARLAVKQQARMR